MLGGIIGQIFPDFHLHRLREVYGARRDAMLVALEALHAPQGVSWTRPKGGMFVWVDLPEARTPLRCCSVPSPPKQVAFVPGAAFFASEPKRNTLHLSFSLSDPATIDEGVGRLR